MTSLACTLALVVAAAPFGPTGSPRHPAVGPAAAVPGNGPEPVVTPGPEEIPLAKVQHARPIRAVASSNPMFVPFMLYRDLLTKTDGSRCAHYPTCSAYGAQAVGRHNVLGVLMTVDRVWRSGQSSSVRSFPLVSGIGPTPRFYDPVEDSAFWWHYPLAAWLGPSIPGLDRALGRHQDDGKDDDTAPSPATAPPR